MSEYAHCPDAEELAAWIDGEVDDATRRRLVTHLDTCARCAEVVEGVLAFQDEEALSEEGVGSDLDDEPAPREAEFTPPPPLIDAPSRRWRPYFAVALAACAVVWAVRVGTPELGGGKDPYLELDSQEISRGGDSDLPILCRKYVETAPVATDRILTCLKETRHSLDLAVFLVTDSHFPEWIRNPSLRKEACRTLDLAWTELTGSVQDARRSAYADCSKEP